MMSEFELEALNKLREVLGLETDDLYDLLCIAAVRIKRYEALIKDNNISTTPEGD